MAGADFNVPRLYDKPIPDLFAQITNQNPTRVLVQVLHEHTNAPIDCVRYTWAQVLQFVKNAAADLKARWVSSLSEDEAKKRIEQPRQPGSSPIVVAILANNGFEMYINILACLLNRWTLLLISPKNSPAAIEHLLVQSVSSLFLVEASNIALGRTMERNIPGLAFTHVATLDIFGSNRRFNPSPLPSWTPEQLKAEMDLPALILHTSGSTGHPKTVAWSHNFMLGSVRGHREEGQHFVGLTYYSIAPLTHALGVFVNVQYILADGYLITFISSPTPKPPSAEALMQYLPFLKGGMVAVPPSILEELHALGPEAVKTAGDSLLLALFGGAPLKKEIGDSLLANGLRLTTGYGSTELSCAMRIELLENPEDWEYLEFREGFDWIWLPVEGDPNLKELLVGPGIDCPAVLNHENPRAYATNDIWERHPRNPNLWRFYARIDNVTVLSNGEKSNNNQIEELLRTDIRIQYVLVFGVGRPLNGVILQPRDMSVPRSEFLAQIQPTIEHANTLLPKHSRLVRELILVAPPDRLFATTDKATVRRKETLDKFQQEIEAAYQLLEQGGSGEDWVFEGSVSDETDLKSFVRSAIHQVKGRDIPDDGDLFEHGFDSLLSIRLRTALLSVVKKTVTGKQPVPRNVVYICPSVNALTAYLLSRATGTFDTKNVTEERIRCAIAKYSRNFITHKPGSYSEDGNIIALTGSTGSAGSCILALLLERTDVKRIYLLNRKGNVPQVIRQATAFKERGLDINMLEKRRDSIIYLDIDFADPNLGLTDTDYKDLRDNVTHIIHAAWHLNFNLILDSYERVHITGVRHLIDLALSSPHVHTPRITFLSTIAAAGQYRGPSSEPSVGETAGQFLVPEEPIDDPSIPLNQGYGHGKYVSERILVNAVQAGLRTTIVRVGQLSGVTTTGAWTSSEHMPILFKSSVSIGMVPIDLPAVRWVPTDISATVIVKQAFLDEAPLQYFAVENPNVTPWTTVVSALCAASPKPLKQVPMTAWLEHIRKSNPDPADVPAVRLLQFFQDKIAANNADDVAALAWEKSVRIAPELAVGRLPEGLVKKYVRWQVEH